MSTPANRRRLARRHTRRLSQTHRLRLDNGRAQTSSVVDLDTEHSSSCIDLTTDDDEVIDLTSVIDSPVVVISAIDQVDENGRRRRSPPRVRTRSQSRSSRNAVPRSQRIAVDSDDDYDGLPAFDVRGTPYRRPEKHGEGTSSDLSTSPTVTISCPICMDDYKQIRRGGRRIMSTICGHMFCSECIWQAVEAQHSCPTCRKRLTHRQTHPLFI